MEIVPFGPDDADALATWTDLVNAIDEADAPWQRSTSPRGADARWRHGFDGEPGTPHLARVDGEVVGWAGYEASDYDNLHLGWVDVGIHPRHRRQGYGSLLLAAMEDKLRRLGRTTVAGGAWDAYAFDAFARRHGYACKSTEMNRRQVLADIDWPELDRRYDAALPHAADYVLERRLGPTPDDELDALALMASSINDAPTDDLDYEDEVFSGGRMRAYEDSVAAHGNELYRVVARHVPTGELAGQTVVAVSRDQPGWGSQHDTSVVRAHRGHRLGLLLKADMLRWLRDAEPGLDSLTTWNAESNEQMIGVNEILGYVVLGRVKVYQRTL
ncbi:GNAT family N-acetyltransferase [Nocardioides ginsengisoli]|uniref:N-acetyltransferase family protein n=1 Tax=Nocardioides ginsengisoli TaxID=363868 RepID=A0ABW3W2C7_9ACTN